MELSVFLPTAIAKLQNPLAGFIAKVFFHPSPECAFKTLSNDNNNVPWVLKKKSTSRAIYTYDTVLLVKMLCMCILLLNGTVKSEWKHCGSTFNCWKTQAWECLITKNQEILS